MKLNYITPEIELIQMSVEDGACATASGTEGFNTVDGTWDTL